MNQILLNIVSAIASALVLKWLGLSKFSRQSSNPAPQRRIGWFWKLLVLLGGFLFYYGLLIFVANLMVGGLEDYRTGLGLSFFTLGALLWIIGRIVIYFKKD